MPFKPPENQPVALSGFTVLQVHGPDAAAFLHAQTMNDVRALAPGRWQWNGWLTPKGRVVALFALLRAAEDRFLVVPPDVPAVELRDALRRFVFRSKVMLDADAGWQVAGGPATDGCAGATAVQAGGGWALDAGGDGGRRTLWLLPAEAHVAPATPETDAAWRAGDLAHGLPRLGPAQREAWTPQMLSLERLAAFSLKKGCYPGQEIVARTHYLGQARRGLVRLGGEGLAEGDAVGDGEREVGRLVCTTADGGEALAVVATDAAGTLRVAGRPAARLPLLDGLQRVT